MSNTSLKEAALQAAAGVTQEEKERFTEDLGKVLNLKVKLDPIRVTLAQDKRLATRVEGCWFFRTPGEKLIDYGLPCTCGKRVEYRKIESLADLGLLLQRDPAPCKGHTCSPSTSESRSTLPVPADCLGELRSEPPHYSWWQRILARLRSRLA